MRKIRTGDEVIVISGRNRGQTGKVRQVIVEKDRVVVEGVNIVIKHLAPRSCAPGWSGRGGSGFACVQRDAARSGDEAADARRRAQK